MNSNKYIALLSRDLVTIILIGVLFANNINKCFTLSVILLNEVCQESICDDGMADTHDQIYQAIRDNFTELSEGSALITETNCPNPISSFNASWKFIPYDNQVDLPKWNSRTIGAIFFIDAEADNPLANVISDNGAVITTQESTCSWIFSTITSPRSQSQPFSGNRQFGLRTNDEGNLEFFTRAIDRAHTTDMLKLLSILKSKCDEEDYFDVGERTWINLQNKLADFLGPAANIKEPSSVQLDFEMVYEKLKSDSPVSFVQCE